MSEQEEQEQIAQRRTKLKELRAVANPFPNDFRRNVMAAELHAEYGEKFDKELEASGVRIKVAGRMMTKRVMGKASFIHIQDMSGRIQLYLQANNLPQGIYQEFRKWDLGDIVGAEGTLFKTKTGELTVRVDDIQLLTKALRPLPDKYHGLVDQELRYRQRYLDLIMNDVARNTFIKRSAIINELRRFLCDRGFLEVETPMMQTLAGGASARPFTTYHNALDLDLYLRVAPELYLKRLVVGGFEKVFEINRNFRNEGLSTRHNPEFTMMEFYQAYSDYQDLMQVTEEMLGSVAKKVSGSSQIEYQGETYDFAGPYQRLTVREALLKYNPALTLDDLSSLARMREIAAHLELPVQDHYGIGKLQIEIFEKTVEEKLRQPTFITAYPVEVSPLSRRNESDPSVADRFELYVGGREIANGFSELNDAEDQAQRFRRQLEERAAGDEEAMQYDADYIRALEHGMPPTAGEGVGIDRLVMLFTDAPSIRDVLLFPHLRPESS